MCSTAATRIWEPPVRPGELISRRRLTATVPADSVGHRQFVDTQLVLEQRLHYALRLWHGDEELAGSQGKFDWVE